MWVDTIVVEIVRIEVMVVEMVTVDTVGVGVVEYEPGVVGDAVGDWYWNDPGESAFVGSGGGIHAFG